MSFPISYGKKAVFKRNVFQASCCKTESQKEAEKIVDFFKSLDPKCIWTAICYRVNLSESVYEEEEGAGVKLMGLLKRMGVTEIVVGIRVWPDGIIAQHDTYRMMLGRAKEVLIETLMVKIEETPVASSRKINIIEIDSVYCETRRDISFDSLATKPQMSRAQLDSNRLKISDIVNKISENDIKALQDYTNHATIGKLLAILLVLLQKQKPTPSLAKQFYTEKNVKVLIQNCDPLAIPKLRIQRAKKMFGKISHLNSSHFEKISRCSALIFQYIRYIINITTSNIPTLPSMQKNLLISKGEYLKSKHVNFYLDGFY